MFALASDRRVSVHRLFCAMTYGMIAGCAGENADNSAGVTIYIALATILPPMLSSRF